MDKLSIQNLVRGYSIETTIREAGRLEKFSDIVPAGTRLYIVYFAGTELQHSVSLAARLRKEGMEPVPHIVARYFKSLSILEDFLKRLSGDAGVKQALVIGGDTAQPSGELESSLQVLDSGILEKHGFTSVGIAGYPEGHRTIGDSVLRYALRRKNEYARKTGANVYIVTQFTFAAEPIIAWEHSHSADIGQLPITAGLPGLASVRTLLKFATDCGIGASVQALSKRAASITKLLTVSAPDNIVAGLADYKATAPNSRIRGVHFFPFGGFKRTAEWANNIVAGKFEL